MDAAGHEQAIDTEIRGPFQIGADRPPPIANRRVGGAIARPRALRDRERLLIDRTVGLAGIEDLPPAAA